MTARHTGITAAIDRNTVPGLPDRNRCLVMGILNVTPDSFSDGGAFLERDQAIARGLELAAEGADIVDVGGESTRPGAQRIPVEEELRRVIPVVRALSTAGIVVSIDTMRAQVASAAVDAGASVVNDVSGGLADPTMAGFVAAADVPFIAMHWRAHSRYMQQHASYNNVVIDVVTELRHRVQALVDAGVDPERIVLDPGLGFAKTAEHNWALLANLDALLALGRPILIGASRKSFLALSPGTGEEPRPPAARDDATAAVSAIAAAGGAFCVRVHKIKPTMDAVRVAQSWRAARSTAGAECPWP